MDEDLKRKFHNMMHIVQIMTGNEPIYFWSMRYDAKHRTLKQITRTNNSSATLLKGVPHRFSSNFNVVVHLKIVDTYFFTRPYAD